MPAANAQGSARTQLVRTRLSRPILRRCFLPAALAAALALPAPAAELPDAALKSATALVHQGQYDAAIAELTRDTRQYPADPRFPTVQGVAYSLKGDTPHALTALHAALRITPGFPPALRAEAQILTSAHRPEAIPVLLQILKAAPGDNTAREMLALEQARANDCPAAIPNFRALSDSLNTHPDSLTRYGGCLFSTGNYAEAATVFARAATLLPSNPGILYDQALSQAHVGQNKAALATLAPVLDSTTDLDTLTLASDTAEADGDTPQSVALLRRAIVLDPRLPDSYVRFAELCMLHESYQAGIDMVSSGLTRLPTSYSLFLARGMLYGGKGDYAHAEADFHSAELLDRQHGTASYGVGIIQAQADHPEQALATARAALQAHPEDPQLNFLVARLLADSGAKPGTPAFTEAKDAAAKAVRLSPGFLPGRNLLAKIDMLNSNPAAAVAQCRAALAIDPSDEAATYRLLLASRQVGDTATVRELAGRVAEQHQHAREDETRRLRYRIVEAGSTASAPPGAPAP
ncbi:tetratricopeptide repeat protein [Acidipila sp. EB88]|uniref:tetratricopeptide repeat protein n=1 Tax=Acidipila sp. EB88 TaxID=2305226 RepID=UPI000F5F632E|nr:tetratricopeptide repeat protein [Acidipila sp. EB88]RRA48248.1 hypothetical protein D1Y84_08045 [Acidipila sp. EB88]